MQWSQLQDLNKVRQSLWLTFPINKNHSFLLTNYSWSYHPQILGKFVRSSKWRTWGKSLIYTTFSAPYRPDSLWQCIAPQHKHTPSYIYTPQAQADLLWGLCHSTLTLILRTHFFVLFTGSWNKILPAESNCKRWVTDSRKLVQVSIRPEGVKKKKIPWKEHIFIFLMKNC